MQTLPSSREQLQGSFLKFVWFVWTRILNLPPPTRIQLDIASYLETGPVRRFIQAFRGIGKTFLTAAYIVWRLWKNPHLKILVVSANETFATEVAVFIKQIIDSPAGDELWPELRTQPGQRSSALAFDVGAVAKSPDKSPSVKAVGIFGQLTGSRADIILSDDVEVPKNAETEAMREKLAERTKEYAAILKTQEDAEIIYLGTPQTQESIYRRLSEKGYDIRVWPARYPLLEKLQGYGPWLAPTLLADIEANPSLAKGVGSTTGGAPTDPQRFSELDLQSREQEYGAAGFLLQFMLDTSQSDAEKFPLKTRHFIVMDTNPTMGPVRVIWGSSPELTIKDLPNVGFDGDRFFRPMHVTPEFVPFTGACLDIDPSGRGKDDTSFVVTKFLNGTVFIRRWGGFRDGYSEDTLLALAMIAAEEKVNIIRVEDNFGDGMFRKLLEPVVSRLHPCKIEGVRAGGQKEARIIRLLEPALRQHRIVLDTEVARQDLAQPDNVRRGLYQLTHLTAQRGSLKHDDRIDVLAQAMSYWAEFMNADANKALAAHRRKEDEKWEKAFFKGTIVGRVVDHRKPLVRGIGRQSR